MAKKTSKPLVVLLGTIFLSWVVSVIFRWENYKSAYPNIEATYHFLLTLKSMLGNSVRQTLLLPVVSLPGEQNHYIPWGGTVQGLAGSYIYTSFPPLSWWPPYLFFKLSSLQPNIFLLFCYGALLGLVSALLIGFLLWKVFNKFTNQKNSKLYAFLLGAVISAGYVFSPEVLLSQGPLIWAHSLSQVIWISALILIYTALENSLGNLKTLILLGLMLFYCWTEQSGYLATVIVGFVFMYLGISLKNNSKIRLGVLLFLVAPAAASLTFAHFSAGVGFTTFTQSLGIRFLARSAQTTEPVTVLLQKLFSGVAASVGPGFFIIIGVGILCLINPKLKVSSEYLANPRKQLILLGLISLSPIAENFIFIQHAGQFSFDRLKWVIPSVIVICFVTFSVLEKKRFVKALVLFTLSITGLLSYYSQIWAPSFLWKPASEQNQLALEWLNNELGPNYECAVFSTNHEVRGYLNTEFNRGIYENVTNSNQGAELTRIRGGCATVFIMTRPVLNEMPMITQIEILDYSGKEVANKTFTHVSSNWGVSYGVVQ